MHYWHFQRTDLNDGLADFLGGFGFGPGHVQHVQMIAAYSGIVDAPKTEKTASDADHVTMETSAELGPANHATEAIGSVPVLALKTA